jgi:hypothetical protein
VLASRGGAESDPGDTVDLGRLALPGRRVRVVAACQKEEQLRSESCLRWPDPCGVCTDLEDFWDPDFNGGDFNPSLGRCEADDCGTVVRGSLKLRGEGGFHRTQPGRYCCYHLNDFMAKRRVRRNRAERGGPVARKPADTRSPQQRQQDSTAGWYSHVRKNTE